MQKSGKLFIFCIHKHTVKHLITPCIPKLLYKNFTFFSLQYIRMSGKNINIDDKKIKKSNFYKNKKVTKIDDIDVNKILVSKKEPYRTKIMIMMLLDHYV